MKLFLITICLLSITHASEDGLVSVPLPLDTIQGEIAVLDVPFIIGKALPESAFHAIGLPYVPPSVSFHEQEDINLASVAGIKVKPFHQSGWDYRIELDYGEVNEKQHTEELLAAVLKCVYKVAQQGEGYSVDVKITNLPPESALHKALTKLTKNRGKRKPVGQ